MSRWGCSLVPEAFGECLESAKGLNSRGCWVTPAGSRVLTGPHGVRLGPLTAACQPCRGSADMGAGTGEEVEGSPPAAAPGCSPRRGSGRSGPRASLVGLQAGPAHGLHLSACCGDPWPGKAGLGDSRSAKPGLRPRTGLVLCHRRLIRVSPQRL